MKNESPHPHVGALAKHKICFQMFQTLRKTHITAAKCWKKTINHFFVFASVYPPTPLFVLFTHAEGALVGLVFFFFT